MRLLYPTAHDRAGELPRGKVYGIYMLIRDSAIYLMARVIPGILGLGSIAILTRFLSAENYGRYTLIFAVSSLFSVIFFAWNIKAIFRHYAAAREEIPNLITTGTVGFLLSFCTAAIVAIFVYANANVAIEPTLLLAGIVLVLALAMFDFVNQLQNLDGNVAGYTTLQTGRALLTILLGGFVAYRTNSAANVILAMALGWLLLICLAGRKVWFAHIDLRLFDPMLIRQMFRYGVPLSMSIALMQLLGSLDRIMLAHFGSTASVGEYAVGFDLSQSTIGALGGALSLAFYPQVMRTLDERGEHVARSELKDYCALQLGLLVPAAVGFAILAPGIANILIGEELRAGAIRVIPWVCGAVFLGVIKAFYTDYAFQLGKWTLGSTLTAAVALIVNVALNLALIPRFGAIGAAQASLGGFLCAIILSIGLGQARGFRLSFPWGDACRIAIAAAGMAVWLLIWRAHVGAVAVILQIIAGAMVYAAIMIATDGLGARRQFRRLAGFVRGH